MTVAELEQLSCPHCSGREFETYSMEELFQEMHDGDWQDHEFTDDIFITYVKCSGCETVLLDRISAVKSAIQEVLYEQPKREEQAEELAKWIAQKGWDLPEDNFDEAIHDYFSSQASNILNGGETMECLIEIYGFEGAKEFVESCAAWAGELGEEENAKAD